jgi:hypothetical protein
VDRVKFNAGVACLVGALLASCGPVARPCTASSCAQGCCNAQGECVAGSSLLECGGGGNACQRCELNATCVDGACGLIAGGVYDASFPSAPDASFNADAGVFDGGGADGGVVTRPDAGLDAGLRNGDGGVSFALDIQPIFDAHCNGCHSWGYSSTVNASGCCGSTCITPGNFGTSVIYGKVSGAPLCGGAMPQGAAPLSAFDLESLRLWILQGAKNN